VKANNKRWQARIEVAKLCHYLGTLDTKEEAALAYDRAARQAGSKSNLNYESMQAAEEAAAQASHSTAIPNSNAHRSTAENISEERRHSSRWVRKDCTHRGGRGKTALIEVGDEMICPALSCSAKKVYEPKDKLAWPAGQKTRKRMMCSACSTNSSC
jgi:hypothetical protein